MRRMHDYHRDGMTQLVRSRLQFVLIYVSREFGLAPLGISEAY
jgi:hypothetical protein